MFKIGSSIDIHNLIRCDSEIEQKIGGISVLTKYKIQAHSDGDIVFHVIAESILGALGLGDLGDWFSDNDEVNKNIDSQIILDLAIKKMFDIGYMIQNIDITLICDCIYFKNYKEIITNNLKCKISPNANFKCTRFENNNDKQIQCFCTILLKNLHYSNI